jgi:hypothetical protein
MEVEQYLICVLSFPVLVKIPYWCQLTSPSSNQENTFLLQAASTINHLNATIEIHKICREIYCNFLIFKANKFY